MPRGQRFTLEEIIAILKEAADGAIVADLSRRHGFLPATFYKWRAQYGGMEADEVRRLRDLETGNVQLTRLLGETHLTIDVLLNASCISKVVWAASIHLLHVKHTAREVTS